jgi:DNA uptake protein ComE-like DNA-binding protein
MKQLAYALIAAGICAAGAFSLPPTQAQTTTQTSSAAQTSSATQTQAIDFPVNLNTATDEQILAIPGTGQRFLREFKEYRPYTNADQFKREMGKYISIDQINQWLQYVFVPTNPNTATEAQLMALKGVDDAMAKFIVAGRSYKDWAALKATLAKKYDAKTVAALERYWTFKSGSA